MNETEHVHQEHWLSSRDRSVITILLIAAFVVILNETALNVALKSVMDDLRVDERTVQWLTTAFMLTMAVVIPITGWLLERITTRFAFILAMSLFTAGTLLCAVAPAFPLVLAGRIVQASGTAIMMPLLMTTIMQLVPPAHRGAMMGTISMVISVAPALGPTLAGFVLQFTSWRGVFGLMVPIGLLMLVIGSLRIVNVNEPMETPLDGLSVPLTMLGFGGLVYGLSLIGDASAPVAELVGVFVVGLGALIAFVWRQLLLAHSERALLDLRAFRHGAFTISVVVMALAMMALFGTVIMLPLLLQQALHLPALTVGLMLLPGGVLMGVLGPIVGRLYDKAGARPLMLPASVVVAVVFWLLSTIQPDTPWWFVVACHMAMSASFAFMFTPLFTIALGSLPKKLYTHGSAIVGTVQQLAGALGTAVFVTVFASQSQAQLAAGVSAEVSLLDGSHLAFLGAGAVWVLAIVATGFLRTPEPSDELPHAH
ncbi:MAG: MDR family MFS transporter [Micropruina sp.]|uniref:MDR family MFS transporter n=1 Tax=Micropruina sp. TaxID=2737536 RepID=UPI0039E72B26